MKDNTIVPKEKRLSHLNPAPFDIFHFGAAYYPEHWDRSMWKNDAKQMVEAGFNCVRLGEFGWYIMEPSEGCFDFSFFDEAIESLASFGIKTIMCTPTAAPPRWLTMNYPDTLRIDCNDLSLLHGSRQQCCYSSLRFRDFSRRITRELMEHYWNNSNVIGWQTDNEMHCHFSECHCPSCQTAFRGYLKESYDTINCLNENWGTSFWSLHFDNFDQIDTPRESRPTFCNPSQQLDYHRFLSHSAYLFQHDQVEILREGKEDWFIFHNGCMKDIDYHGEFGRDLDVLGNDVYPLFDRVSTPDKIRFSHSYNLDRVRSLCGNFIIPEHQSGPGGQSPYIHRTPEPGELRKMTYTSIARGADSLLYFRWRTCRFGAEEYWCGILDHDNIPRRRFQEVSKVGSELKLLGPEVIGSSVRIDCAVAAKDYDNFTAHKTYSLGLPSSDNISEAIHKCLYSQGMSVGCIQPDDDLSGIKLYVIPHMEIIKDTWLPNLESYVKNGGVLLIGARCGTRKVNNQITSQSFPGILSGLTGITVEEYGRLDNGSGISCKDRTFNGEHWYELLKMNDAGTFANWQDGFKAGKPAVSIRPVGKGQVIYAGTYLTEQVCEKLLPELVSLARLERPFPNLSPDIDVVRRYKDGAELIFLINHYSTEVDGGVLPDGEILVGNNNAIFSAFDVKILKR